MDRKGCDTMTITNVTGWNQLISGDIVGCTFAIFNEATLGYCVAILFVVLQILIYMKTKNITPMWIFGLFFCSLFGLSFISQNSIVFIFVLLVLESAGILYYMFFK